MITETAETYGEDRATSLIKNHRHHQLARALPFLCFPISLSPYALTVSEARWVMTYYSKNL